MVQGPGQEVDILVSLLIVGSTLIRIQIIETIMVDYFLEIIKGKIEAG